MRQVSTGLATMEWSRLRSTSQFSIFAWVAGILLRQGFAGQARRLVGTG